MVIRVLLELGHAWRGRNGNRQEIATKIYGGWRVEQSRRQPLTARLGTEIPATHSGFSGPECCG
jgi:hypothetical protein